VHRSREYAVGLWNSDRQLSDISSSKDGFADSGKTGMKRQLFRLAVALAFACAPGVASAQSLPAKNLAEKLGYPKDAKLLIVHADDVAETHAVNAATFKALENGYVNSASIMVPCPWFPEAADFAKSHPEADLGLHLTLTAERVYYRWGPVA